MTKALIDCDVVVYQAGFTADNTYYTIGKKKCKYKKDAKKWCDVHGIDYNEIIKHHDAATIDKAMEAVDTMMEGIIGATSADSHVGFLSGERNFRHDVAKTQPYKGNRKEANKPHLFVEIREWLVDKWGVQVVDGIEADDALGIHASDDTIICTIDKDLLQVPGWHYNWQKRAFIEVTQRDGDINFWSQMLTGDRTDNILGPVKHTPYGERLARRVLEKAEDYQEMARAVAMYYARAYEDPEARMLENGKLLWIMRSEDDEWEI